MEACWTLTLAGLRRSEVMALLWSDIDLAAGTVTVNGGRVDMGRDSLVVTAPKSDRGRRGLPLPPVMLAAIKRTQKVRQAECLRWGVPWDESAFIAVDEALRPLRPEVYSDSWGRLMVAAGCKRPVTLHGARHGSATRMLDAGIPVHIVAAWHGHDPAVTLRTYAHADVGGLILAGQALSG